MRALPEDLVTEILLKLPVKSLLRFRSICRSWNHLIRSSDFIKKHIKHHSTKKDYILITKSPLPLHPYNSFSRSSPNLQIPPLSLHSYDSLSLISPDLQIPYDAKVHFPIELYGPCNGIICISINRENIMLCNPILREFKLIQPFSFSSDHGRWFDVSIGFGFDSWTEDYKVVSIVRQTQRDNYYNVVVSERKVEVYEHSNRSWRQIKTQMVLEQNYLQLSLATNWNEIIHWINYNKEILSFDIKTEVFQLITLPSDPQEEGKKMYLTVLNEFLAVFACTSTFDPTDQFIDLWKMEDYGVEESWTKLFTIGPVAGIEAPLLLWKDDAIIVEGFELPVSDDHPPGKLFTCSAATLKIEDLEIDGLLGSFRVMICNESLVSIDG